MPIKKRKMGKVTVWTLGDEKKKIYPTDQDFKELAAKIRSK
jgi:hypothetical protein